MDTKALDTFRRALGVVLIAAAALGGTACSREEPKSAEQQHVESMMAILVQVQQNLGRIRQKEAVVERLSSDIEGQQEKSPEQIGREINGNIRFIDSTLTASRNLVKRLEEENRSSSYRVDALDRLSRELKGEIENRGREIASMKGEISKLNREISRLTNTVDVMDDVISEQEDRMSTGYYIVGTVSQLTARGVLVDRGPIAKIFGAGPALSSDFDTRPFRQVDITETRDIYIDKPSGRLHVVTPHTRSSYQIVGGDSASLLLIKDPAEFWRKSRCLVIVEE